MSESSPQPPQRPKPPEDAPLQDAPRLEPTVEPADVFELADDPPANSSDSNNAQQAQPQSAAQQPEWYCARPGEQREGPFTLAELQRRVASGRLRPGDLVWRSGMKDWTPAREVGVLFGSGPGQAVPPPPPGAAGKASAALSGIEPSALWGRIDRFFAQPWIYRLTGRICAVWGLLVALVSLALLIVGKHWFTTALVLGLIFIVCEAAGAILEALRQTPGAAQEPEKKEQATGGLR